MHISGEPLLDPIIKKECGGWGGAVHDVNDAKQRAFAVEQRNPLLNEESLINKHQLGAKHRTNVLVKKKKKRKKNL